MIKNYLTIIWRNLTRHKVFSIINLAGLTVSLTSVMLITIYIRYQLSYDKYLPDADRIYRIYAEKKVSGVSNVMLMIPTGTAEMTKNEFPEITDFVQLNPFHTVLSTTKKEFDMSMLRSGDNFFSLFRFPFISGSAPDKKLVKDWIVLTESASKKFFGTENPVNKTIADKYGTPLIVVGVIKDIPSNTHFQADAICHMNYPWAQKPLNWKGYSSTYQYIILDKNANAKNLEEKFSSIYKKYDFPAESKIGLQPLTSIHLRSNFSNELGTNSDIRYIYIFGIAAILLLFLASINYVNLTTARSMQRAREVGVRKVLGANKNSLVFQFIGEAFLFFLLSTVAAMLLSYTSYPLFSKLLNIEASRVLLFDNTGLLFTIGIVIVFGLLAGVYPAFYLSKQSPAFVIKGTMIRDPFNTGLRKSLVVFQFIVSVFFIVATITIFQQLRFIQTKNLGFAKDNLLILPSQAYGKNFAAFSNELTLKAGVKDISVCSWNPGIHGGAATGTMTDSKDTTKDLSISFMAGDLNFIKTLGIEITEGRSFSEKFASDTLNVSGDAYGKLSFEDLLEFETNRSIILNQTSVKALGLQEPVVGQKLKTPLIRGTIIGIAKDFNALTLHHQVTPFVLEANNKYTTGFAYVRLNNGNVRESIRYIESIWKRYYPDKIFSMSFVDDSLNRLYNSEKITAGLFSSFTILGIGIACLGLFGLALFMIEQRSKEISIRKILGASVAQISALLSKQFLMPVLLGSLIAFPLAWFAMNKWLEDFAYRITINWKIFLLSLGLAFVIALVTVCFQALKAASANPADNLRAE